MPRQTRGASALLARAAGDVVGRVSPLNRLFSSHALDGFGVRAFEGDPAGGGGAAGGGGGGAGDAGDAGGTKEETVPKSEADKAFKTRDEAKRNLRLVASALGIDPASIRVVKNDGEDAAANPFKLESEELTEALALIEAGREAKKGKQQKKGDAGWQEREAELTTAHQRQLQKVSDGATAKETAYAAWIENHAIVGEIRKAAKAEGAIDDAGDGAYDDVVALIRSSIKVDRAFDDESGALTIKVTPHNPDGTPMLDSTGKPASVQAAVAALLKARPKFKIPGFTAGPGAGGKGTGAAGSAGSPNLSIAQHAAGAASALFGKKAAGK